MTEQFTATDVPATEGGAAANGLGLDARAETVYRTLLARRRWHRGALADHCRLAAPQLTAVLDQLSASGLVRHSQDEPGALRAVEPAVALPGLAATAIARGSDGHTVSATAVQRFVALHETSDRRFETDGELAASDDASAVVERLVSHATATFTFLAPHYVADGPHFSRPILEAAQRRGLTVRAVWGGRVSGHIGAWEHGERMAAAGFAPQVLATIPVSAVVVDSDAALVIPDNARPLVLRSGPQLRAVIDLAAQLVDTATVIKALAPRVEPIDSAPRCQRVLRLLAEGCTDDTMARRLGCSVRTIRNEVATAMSTLNARSRFQAGVYAVQAGLI